ncbi:membrane hypothetical protein [Vibrio chagasii]|uniref:hypothetical protein n=1 Tax=Vibrio chagasii TaxID=170679 RepID=UPI003387A9AA|nr:membrane hypothetical protein [Vibrio chagasii]
MSFLNVSFRAIAIIIKFLSLAFITRGLSDGELDVYFLIITISAVVSQLFGLQTFHIVMRRFNRNNVKDVIDIQLYQHIVVLVFLVLNFIFFRNYIKEYINHTILILLVLILSEILVTEISRLFIVIGESVYSNILACINSLNYLMFGLAINYWPEVFSGLSSWTFLIVPTCLISISMFFFIFKKNGYNFFTRRFYKSDIITLVCDSKPYIISQVLNLTIIYLSRFILDYQNISALLSYYSILHSFSSVVSVFLTVGIIAPLSPMYMKGNTITIKSIMVKTIIFSLIAILILMVFYPVIVLFIGKDGLIDYQLDFLILLVGTTAFSVSQVLQLFFLKYEYDFVNLYSYAISGGASIILGFMLIPIFHISGAAMTFLISSFVLLTIRIFFYNKYNQGKI